MQPGIPSVFKVVNRHAGKFVPAHHDKLMELFSDDVLIAVLESPTSTEWVFQEPNVPVVVPPAAVSKDIPYVFVRHPNISDADCDSLGMLTSTKIGAPLLSTPLGPRVPINHIISAIHQLMHSYHPIDHVISAVLPNQSRGLTGISTYREHPFPFDLCL